MDAGVRRRVTVGSPGHVCISGGVNNREQPSQPSPLSHQTVACDGCDGGDGHRLLLWPAHAYMPRQNGSFLAKVPCGRRQRGASIASGCKPRFAGFAVCTPAKGGTGFVPLEPKSGHPYSCQYWCGLPLISGPKNGKSATVKLGRGKGPAVYADPWEVCIQAMR